MKKVFGSLQSKVTMEGSLESIFLKISMKRMVFTTIFPLQEHHDKMELLRGKIDLFKKWLEPCLMITQSLNTFRLK